MLVRPDGEQQPSAWRFPSAGTALLTALWLHKSLVVQSNGDEVRPVDWVQSAAMLVRRSAAEEIGYFDPDFFVYSDEVDFCKRLADAGYHSLYVPSARAVHHEQLSTGTVPSRRIVEFSRNRDRYMRKHHSKLSAWTVRLLTAWTYGLRTVGALVLPGHNPKRYAKHVTATLLPAPRRGPARGRRGVQPAAGAPGSRDRASKTTSRCELAGPEEPRGVERERDRGQHQRPRHEADHARRSAAAARPRRSARRRPARTAARRFHSNATGNSLWVRTHIATSITA